METTLNVLGSYWPILALVVVAACYKLVLRAFGMIVISQDSIGIVNKKWVLFGKNKSLPDGSIVALNGEAGIQADTLAPGVHFRLWPWQYAVTLQKFVTIEKGQLGVVDARDGKPLSGGRVLGKEVNASNSFQDARAFLSGGGERGPQIAIIPPGTYRINTALFTISTAAVTEIADTKVGIVTTKEGKPLKTGDIAGPEIANHNSFQNPQTFLDGGGSKGLQEQVILAGRYFINPRFATVESVDMTKVPIANVGVVICYVGKEGVDVSGESFKHSNLVSQGEKGVWADPLDPGMYPINTYTRRVELVPTSNIVLNWADNAETGAHKLDENLCTITVRSSDGFTFNLDVSQIIHISCSEAPKVIARFGNMLNLVTQVLEPTIGNYFRNAAQKSDVIDFLKNRSERQAEAKASISAALVEYNVNAVDTLIGDITPPASLMETLTQRKLAEQEQITYGTQKLTEETRKDLQQAKAMADTQANVVASERKVSIADFDAQSAVKKAEGEAKAKTINAEADANVITTVGNAEATKTKAIGTAEADVIKQKISSMESGNYAAVQIANSLATNKIKLVPDITVTGSGDKGGGTIVDVLIANMLRNQNGVVKETK
jgi:uncharacterized membrane protein YqiK